MFECKYCGQKDETSRRYRVCSSCIALCMKDEERNVYVMDFTTWQKHKDQIKYRTMLIAK